MRDTISAVFRQALWFVGLWAAGVATLGAVGLLIRAALRVA